jgi:fido (protein-threonine AMPylation protein)
MVYVYKKLIGKKPYYYLRVSERKGKKVVSRDLAYLGNSIKEVKKELKNLSKYKKEIRKSYKKIHQFLESNHYLEKTEKLKLKKDSFLDKKQTGVEACKLHYNSEFKRLDNLTKKEIFKQFIIEFAFNTTSIEGNTITLEEARNLLEEGKTPKNKTLREIYDLQNSEKVFFELLESKEDLSHDFITKVHDKLLENIDSRKGYRTRDIRVFKATFKSTPGIFVKTDMGLLLKWHNKNKKKLHPLVLAGIFHHKFEKIHPFMDGNGRTGRMLLNYILMKNNYSPLIIHNKTRSEYLAFLKDADKAGLNTNKKEDYLKLVQYIADEMINFYWDIFL